MIKSLIRLILPVCVFLFSITPCFSQTSSGTLTISDQWTSTQNQVVQQDINVQQEALPSPVDGDEVVVKFKTGVSDTTAAGIIQRNGTQVKKKNTSAGFYHLRIVSGETVSAVVARFKADVNVLYAEPVYYYKSRFIPNDEHYPRQWNLDNPLTGGINIQKAWDVTRGDPRVIIAVVDTGVAYENYYDQTNYFYKAPDLAQTNFVPGFDFVNNDTHPNDDTWHGTLIAGIIAQSTHNGLGTAGICPNCSIMPVKVLSKDGLGNTIGIAEGIIWAADHGAKVINLSFGGPESALVIQDACAYAYSKGATIVCAAGNRGMDRVLYPAAYDNYCIAVGGTRLDETRAYYSDYGSSLDLVAPGGDTRIDQNRDNLGDGILAMTFGPAGYNNWVYLYAVGTSMAAAHVSGVAGLIISAGIATTPDEVRKVLQETAEDRGPIGFDIEHGWGLVDAGAALAYVKEEEGASVIGTEPQPTPTPDAAIPMPVLPTATPVASPSPVTSGAVTPTPAPVDASVQTGDGTEILPVGDGSDIINLRGHPMRLVNGKYEYLNRLGSFDDCRCEIDAKDVPISYAYSQADLVFAGEVLQFHKWRTFDTKRGILRFMRGVYTLDVKRVYKGSGIGEKVKVRFARYCLDQEFPLRDSCDLVQYCRPPFVRGKTYLIYVRKSPDPEYYEVDACSRVFSEEDAAGDLAVLNSLPLQ